MSAPQQGSSEPDHAEPVAVFAYGMLMADEVLSHILFGLSEDPNRPPSHNRQAAVLHGYRRVSVIYAQYPAIIPSELSNKVEGHLISPITPDQLKKLDRFEGEQFRRLTVRVVLQETGEQVPAQAYMWNDTKQWLEPDKEWDYSAFREQMITWFRSPRDLK